MSADLSINQPLVSVVIPCFNHGRYLHTAIESVLAQSYLNYEVIVVDDGSLDNTKEVAERFSVVKYIYQKNQGLSAARNTGIDNCKGDFIIFLDADDWLLEGAIQINSSYLLQNPDVAFVSGAHLKVIEEKGLTEEKKIVVNTNHYERLLRGNFIAMHATVMFERWVFDSFRYDTTLNAFEDYDMYLNVSRKFRIIHHQALIAAYRIHQSNMSGNIPLMLNSALKVLKRQQKNLVSRDEQRSYIIGLKYWKDYYCGNLYRNLDRQPWSVAIRHKEEMRMLFACNPLLYVKLLLKKLINAG